MKSKIVAVSGLLAGLMVSFQASATSVIDAATKTAVGAGFTDMKDTLLDLVVVSVPFVIAGAVIIAAPRIIKGLVKMASH